MIPVLQTRSGGHDAPDEEKGDCLAARLASILEVQIGTMTVPHTDEWWLYVIRNLARFGKTAAHFMGGQLDPPNAHWIAHVPSRNMAEHAPGIPVLHALVMHNTTVAHDPSNHNRYELGTPLHHLDVRSGHPHPPPQHMTALRYTLALAIAAAMILYVIAAYKADERCKATGGTPTAHWIGKTAYTTCEP